MSGLYPPDNDDVIHKAIQAIAKREGCSERLVGRCLFDIPMWSSPQHLALIKKKSHQYNECARYARNLLRAMYGLSEDEKLDLYGSGAATVAQVSILAETMAGDADDLAERLSRHDRRGGKNIAAHNVAETIRRLYRRLRRPITFGQNQDGSPSTPFGKSVEFALGELGVRADWRQPAFAARERQGDIHVRLMRCVRHHATRSNTKSEV